MSRQVALVDAFTSVPGRGNRAGVVLDGRGLGADEMLAIAAATPASETAFGLPSHDPEAYDLEVRYFSRVREIPICGHATIAFHHHRALRLGLPPGVLRVKTGAGILPVEVVRVGGGVRVIMTQAEPRLLARPTAAERSPALRALGLTEEDLAHSLPVEVVTTGHAKVLVPIRSVARLDALRPDRDALLACSPVFGANGFFVFTLDRRPGDPPDLLTHGRMFAPATGVDEDPVTGNANGPAGAYLCWHGRLGGTGLVRRYRGAQGYAMGRPGEVEVIVHGEGAEVRRVQVSGEAIMASEVC